LAIHLVLKSATENLQFPDCDEAGILFVGRIKGEVWEGISPPSIIRESQVGI
jgi:hypothetical protein